MIYQLIYLSLAKKEFPITELLDLLSQSRKNNNQYYITGLLLYKGRYFIQLLEGDKEAVTGIMQKIEQDSRHEDIIYLYRETTSASHRLFSDWSMGFSAMKFLDQMGLEDLIINDLVKTRVKLDAHPHSKPGCLLRTILEQFY